MTSPFNVTPVQPQAAENAASPRYTEEELKKIKKACGDFESILTYQLLKTMRKTIPESANGTSHHGKDTYTMMMDQKLAESISAKGNGLGLQKVLYDQFTKTNAREISGEVKNKLK
ncbi:MAG: rod-binding protein [Deltaproteobacteria bacterium]